jgi:hypothetical protein
MMDAGRQTARRAVEPFDRAKPNIARVWDYWLGGQARHELEIEVD